jgi:predicted ATPase/DNA-binding SARP family transcriptional activator
MAHDRRWSAGPDRGTSVGYLDLPAAQLVGLPWWVAQNGPTPSMEFRILGPLEVLDGDKSLPLGGVKQREVLAALLLRPNRIVSADRLVDLLWAEDPPLTAGNVIQVYVSKLRQLLGSRRLGRSGPGYLLQVGTGELDLENFESLLTRGREDLQAGRPEVAAADLRKALALWRGPALMDLEGAAFAPGERARLNELRLSALEDRIEADLRIGRHAVLVAELEGLLRDHPLRERFAGQLMLALGRSGRAADASQAYRKTYDIFVEQGLEPGSDLQLLLRQILNQDPSLSLAGAATMPPLLPKHNLPLQLTTFVGRARDIAEVQRILRQSRLLTLVGTGGIGKTRLAVEAVQSLLAEFAHGIRFVELAPVKAEELVSDTVAQVVLSDQSGRPLAEDLIQYLANKHLLLVLDNCEHVIDAVARLTKRLLGAAPGLTILATSREPLNIGGETVRRVPPLAVPDTNTALGIEELAVQEAVMLFLDRALDAIPDFQLNDGNAGTIAGLCRSLEGIPLALELAAARLRVLSIDAVSAGLKHRFRLLAGTARASEPRHQTLRATIDWSYDLLTEPERKLFRRLSVFAGGFDLEAAEQVGADAGMDTIEHLTHLVDKSFVLALHGNRGVKRYDMLETLREYGHERQAEHGGADADRTSAAHARFFLGLAETLRAHESTPAEEGWIQRLTPEQENLRTALQWAETREPELGLRLAWMLARFWDLKGVLREERMWLERMLAADENPSDLRVRALQELGFLAWRQGDYVNAGTSLEMAIQTAERLGDEPPPSVLNLLGLLAISRGDHSRALLLAEQGLRSPRLDASGEATARWIIGLALYFRGEFDACRELFTRSRQLRVGDPVGLAQSIGMLGVLETDLGNTSDAEALLVESISIMRKVEDLANLPFTLEGLARAVAAKGEARRALGLVATAEALRAATGSSSIPPWQDRVQRSLAPIHVRMGIEADAIMAAAHALPLERALNELVGPRTLHREG